MAEAAAQSPIPGASPLTARFERQQAEEFARRSNSAQTRRAYQRVVREFFAATGNLAPLAITPAQVRSWRDALLQRRQKAATVSFKLSVVRAFFGYLKELGLLERNPADTKFVLPPALPETLAGRALTPEEVRQVLAGPERSKVEGARDYALLLVLFRLGLRVAEACALRASDLKWSHGRWLIKLKVKGGRERTLPLPDEVRLAIKEYLKLDAQRRQHLHSDGADAYLFQPLVNYRTLEFAKEFMAGTKVSRRENEAGLISRSAEALAQLLEMGRKGEELFALQVGHIGLPYCLLSHVPSCWASLTFDGLVDCESFFINVSL